MSSKFKLLCFGFGQVARYFVKNLIKKNYKFELVTTNTTKTQIKEINNLKFTSYYFTDSKFDDNLLKEIDTSNKILISIPPKNQEDLVLKIFDVNFKKNKFDWVTYLSATSIYGDKKGNWVDEETKPKPTSSRGIDRLKAETNWMNYYKKYNLPIQIFRLSGIYSLENNVIKRLQKETVKIVEKKNHFFSRIHVEDIAEILRLSLKKFVPGQIFNISDNYPCSNEELVSYAANLIKIDMPKKIKTSDIKNENLKSFYKDSKKVNNKKMKNFFKYKLKYPSFKEGLDVIKNHIV